MGISLNSDGMNLGAIWNAGLSFGADPSFDTDRTPSTVSVSAIDLMEPITSSGGLGPWEQFWQDTAKAGFGYLIAKDAAKNNVTPKQTVYVPTANAGGQAYQPTLAGGNLLMLLVVGGIAFMALKD